MKANLYIHNIGQLITCQGSYRKGAKAMGDIGVIEGPCAVLIKDGVIAFAGKESEVAESMTKGIESLDAQGSAVLPGFVDSHTHVVFGGYREDEFQWRLAGESYMSIMQKGGGIASTTKATRAASHEELKQAALLHLYNMLSMGVTTCEAKSGYGMDLETEIRQLEVINEIGKCQPIDICPTFMGAHDTPTEFKGDPTGYIEYIVKEVLPIVKEKGLADICDIFTEKGVFDHAQTRRLLDAAKAMGMKVKMHADEIVPFGGAELAAELGCLSADHLLQISEKGIKALAQSETIATLLPLTAFSLKADYAPARKMIDEGCAVAVASDLNPGSCFSASIPLLIALATINMGMTIEETISAMTINAAKAIDMHDKVGSIEVGKKGDLIILQYPSYKFLSYHFGMNIVKTTVKNGIPYHNQISNIQSK
ncbi:imidazolonepropionase [Porphyromonas sp.]|uniref:imidazolonepropionase n=1 Tax=Porphyromonas sp. TaxID=1924944 RepID=UPI0026DD14AC|nr:imidazolonepropionase [Porphyromonas sp.]MDO4695418.1 imidazolonepropionase [Porphyromonas sp.]MDO4770534.1 imidazolonepropionase [Porphyromonas sp.]